MFCLSCSLFIPPSISQWYYEAELPVGCCHVGGPMHLEGLCMVHLYKIFVKNHDGEGRHDCTRVSSTISSTWGPSGAPNLWCTPFGEHDSKCSSSPHVWTTFTMTECQGHLTQLHSWSPRVANHLLQRTPATSPLMCGWGSNLPQTLENPPNYFSDCVKQEQ